MKSKISLFLLFSQALFANESPLEKKAAPAASIAAAKTSQPGSFFVIDPKTRATDYVQAFDFLRKDKPTLKIRILLSNGQELSQVTDLSTTHGGSLLLAKYLSNQGTKYQIIPVEELGELSYSPS